MFLGTSIGFPSNRPRCYCLITLYILPIPAALFRLWVFKAKCDTPMSPATKVAQPKTHQAFPSCWGCPVPQKKHLQSKRNRAPAAPVILWVPFLKEYIHLQSKKEAGPQPSPLSPLSSGPGLRVPPGVQDLGDHRQGPRAASVAGFARGERVEGSEFFWTDPPEVCDLGWSYPPLPPVSFRGFGLRTRENGPRKGRSVPAVSRQLGAERWPWRILHVKSSQFQGGCQEATASLALSLKCHGCALHIASKFQQAIVLLDWGEC